MSTSENTLPQVADSAAENPPPSNGVEARILGASKNCSKGESGHADVDGLEEATHKLAITASQGSETTAKAVEADPKPKSKRKSQTQRQRAKAKAAKATASRQGEAGTSKDEPATPAPSKAPPKVPKGKQGKRGAETPKGEARPPSTPANPKRTREDLSSASSQGDSAKRSQDRKRVATDHGAVAAKTRKGPSGTKPGRSHPPPTSKGAPKTSRSYAEVARKANDLVIFCITSPEGYSAEQTALIRDRLNGAAVAAQAAGTSLKLGNPGGHRRMFKITAEDDLTKKWLTDYVDSKKLDNVWPDAQFSIKQIGELERRHKASLLVPSESNQTSEQVLELIQGTNKFLNTKGWLVHRNDHIKGPPKGNLMHVTLPEADKVALDQRKGIIYLGLHKVQVRTHSGKRTGTPPPKEPCKKRK